MITENPKMLIVLIASLPPLVWGIVILVGIVRKWSFFVKPLPALLDRSRLSVSIHNRFGARGLKIFWLALAIVGIAMSAILPFILLWMMNSTNN